MLRRRWVNSRVFLLAVALAGLEVGGHGLADAAPQNRVAAPASTPVLVRLRTGASLEHPALSRASLYQAPSTHWALMAPEALGAARAAGLISKVFAPPPAAGHFYFVRVDRPEEQPEARFQALDSDFEVQVFWATEADAAQLGRFGAHLQRLALLPRFDPAPASAPQERSETWNAAVDALVNQVSEDSWASSLQELSGDIPFELDGAVEEIYSRHIDHPDNTLAGDYLADRLESYGYQVSFQTFTYNGNVERNVIARLPGTLRPNEVYVFGGHYDSRSENLSDATAPAPGADDNGSGTVAVLEAARVLAKSRFESTIEFVLFSAEEQGMVGSEEYVKQAASTGKQVRGAILTDMVSYWSGTYKLIIEGTVRYRNFMTRAQTAAKDYSDLPTEMHYFSFASDHVSFQTAGIPAYLLIEKEWDSYPDYHSVDDVFENCDPHMGAEVTRLTVATLADIARLMP